jgi:predicted Ser/Thr protein kinase
MTPDQWRQVRDLFERALDRPAADLDAWLAREAGDPAIAAEVRSLLTHHTRAGAFLEAPVADSVASLLSEDARFEAGDAVGAYRIKREIGRGGMGRVYLATDTRLGRDVALKVLPPHLVRDQAQRERLRREARAAAALSHPGICTVYALEEIDDDVVIATEYVDGHTLRDEILRTLRPSPRDVLESARELAAALAAAHGRGITHRDLKPENVMRAASGRLKILDFGLAIVDPGADGLDAPRVTTPGTLIGTPAYMAPEQLNNGTVDVRTDLFALGVLLYEYATGVHPFEAQPAIAMAARILEGDPRPLASMRDDLPAQVTLVVERCLRKRQAERFASAADVVLALSSTDARAAGSGGAVWWRTHMAVAIALYVLAVTAGWLVKEWDHGLAETGFVVVAMLATVGTVLRGHLLFAERNHDRRTFRAELRRATPALLGVDLSIAAALVAEGLWVTRARSVPGVLITALGLGIALARLVPERSTTEVAFGDSGGRV